MAEYEPIEYVDQANPLKGDPAAPRLNAANLAKMQTQYAEVLAEVEGGAGPINTALNAAYVPQKVYCFLLAGQSNVAVSSGGQPLVAADTTPHPQIKQYGFTSKVIEPAVDPLDHNDTSIGAGFAMQFARRLVAHLGPGAVVLLVPTAKGGTALSAGGTTAWRWGVANNLSAKAAEHYEAAVGAAASEWPSAEVVHGGVLWLQGEGDTATGEDQYRTDLEALIAGFREGMDADTPFICGGMVPEGIAATSGREWIDFVHQSTPYRVTRTGFAPSVAGHTQDNLHYTAKGHRLLAHGFFVEYLRIVGGSQPTELPDYPTDAVIWRETFEGLSGSINNLPPSIDNHGDLYYLASSNIEVGSGQAVMTAQGGTRRTATTLGDTAATASGRMTVCYLSGTAHPVVFGKHRNDDNHVRAEMTASAISLYKRVEGSQTTLDTYSHTRTSNDRLELVVDDNNVSVKLNGSEVIAPVAVADSLGTRFGFGVVGSTGNTCTIAGGVDGPTLHAL